jgi:alpha-tubulin suppressor-like RCC1 family protein
LHLKGTKEYAGYTSGAVPVNPISPKAVFMTTDGSWHGDFDYYANHMRAAIATDYLLDAVWVRDSSLYVHHMAMGETIGYVLKVRQSSPSGLYDSKADYPLNAVHSSLMGDPTLRLHVVQPASSLQVVYDGGSAQLSWGSSSDTITGYNVYSAPSRGGPYTYVGQTDQHTTSFVHSTPANSYMVRAIKYETAYSGSGSYYNASQGVIWSASGGVAPVITFQPGQSTNLVGGSAVFTVGAIGSSPLSYQWRKNGSDISMSVNNTATSVSFVIDSVTVNDPGLYSVRVSNGSGNVTSASANLYVDTPPTVVNDTATTAERTSIDINVLANDSDPDGPSSLSVIAAGIPNYDGTFPSTTVGHGTVQVIPPGTIRYTPNPGFFGSELPVFNYLVSDGLATLSGTVSVTVPDASMGVHDLTGYGLTGSDIGNGRGSSRAFPNDDWEITSAGADSEGTSHIEWMPINGNFNVSVQIKSYYEPIFGPSVGLMIRDSVSSGAQFVSIGVGTSSFEVGSKANGQQLPSYSQYTTPTFTFPNAYVSLTRDGDTITVFGSPDGATWTPMGAITLPNLSNALEVGLYTAGYGQVALFHGFSVKCIDGVLSGSAGVAHAAYVMTDGTVWSVGDNSSGQLGTGSFGIFSTSEVQARGIDKAAAVACGASDTVVLKTDGTVWSWGASSTPQPAQKANLSSIITIASGSASFYALRADGTVFAWGDNLFGQLGVTASGPNQTPTAITSLTGVIDITAGESFAAALLDNGTIKTWGRGTEGQLGNNLNTTTPNRVTVVTSSGATLTGIKRIRAGRDFMFAIGSDGLVRGWGHNQAYQLGNGITANSPYAVTINNLSSVVDIASGSTHSLAVKANGTVSVWGSGSSGQLGLGAVTVQATPVQLGSFSHVRSVTAGWDSSHWLESGSTARSFGNNPYGQLGDSSTQLRTSPVVATAITDSSKLGVLSAMAGMLHSLVLYSDGHVWAAGYNARGQLGINSTVSPQTLPVLVQNLTGIIAVAGGGLHSIALRDDGTVWCWGDNGSGQIGSTTAPNPSTLPVQVTGTGFTDIIAIAAKGNFNLALRADGAVFAWGSNSDGQIGVGTPPGTSPTPVQVGAIAGAKAIAACDFHSMAILDNGTVKAWGQNSGGQIGNGGNQTPQASPTFVLSAAGVNLTGVKALDGGSMHSLALKSDGTVLSWGDDSFGQLGNGLTQSFYPNPVSTISLISSVAGARFRGHALKSDGSVWAWGYNVYGYYGDGSTTGATTPTLINASILSSLRKLSGGYDHTLFQTSGGTVRSSGRNQYGQLGIGSSSPQYTALDSKF